MRATCRVLLLSVLLSAGCETEETVWVPFNLEGQEVEVRVSDSCDPADDPEPLELLSSLGKRHVGDASVEPWCGPVGTSHEITVEVFDEWQDVVGRVTIDVDPEAVSDLDGDGEEDSRGELEYELRQDSADIGLWAITLQSLGAEGEARTDTFGIVLWQPELLQDDVATAETPE